MSQPTIDDLKEIVEIIVNDFNDSQSFDSYYFEDSEITVAWWGERDTYTALKDDKTWEDYSPSDIHIVIEGLTEKDLKNYILDVHGYDWDLEKEKKEGKFKIRYENNMTSYLLDETFDSEKQANQFIEENFFEGELQFYNAELKT